MRHIVELRINETLQTGAVGKPHLPDGENVYLFLEFTIVPENRTQTQITLNRSLPQLDSDSLQDSS